MKDEEIHIERVIVKQIENILNVWINTKYIDGKKDIIICVYISP